MTTKLFLTILFILTFNFLFACGSKTDNSDTLYKKTKKSYGIGFIPSKTQKINGWAIGWLQLGAFETDSAQIINGIYTNLSPLSVLLGGMSLPYIFWFPFAVFKDSLDIPYLDDKIIENEINGIALSFFEASDRYKVNGIHISGVLIMMYKLNGISISLGATKYASFDGLMMSGLYNWAEKGRGLQIGLVNNAFQMKGIQVGLWNKIGKRAFPFLNFNFKSK